MKPPGTIHSEIRARYTRAASLLRGPSNQGQNAPVFLETGTNFGSALYTPAELDRLPVTAIAASLGCGSPTAAAVLRPGYRVLDLGCGGGIDVLLAAHSVGEQGIVVGFDMTAAMLDIAQEGARLAAVGNVCFVRGAIERLPFALGAFHVVMSNCSINLSTDKRMALAEAARVLVPGGYLHLTDVLADDALTLAQRLERSAETGCTVGALSRSEYIKLLTEVGFQNVTVDVRHPVADRMAAARIAAGKPR